MARAKDSAAWLSFLAEPGPVRSPRPADRGLLHGPVPREPHALVVLNDVGDICVVYLVFRSGSRQNLVPWTVALTLKPALVSW